MAILEELIRPLTLREFLSTHYTRTPIATPYTAQSYRGLLNWPLLSEIMDSGYSDCWLVKKGFKHPNPHYSTGKLKFNIAIEEFKSGYSVVIRHSEKAHPKLADIADDFFKLFHKPIDIQLYVTPSGEEGFDWHYDIEDVFVIQSKGEKEFKLKPNSVNPNPIVMPKDLEFYKETSKTEIRCWLKSGDWLYIPRGYWHKAQALTDSFHLSVGVLNQ